MRNTLQDLNNHLFEQLERVNNNDLSDEELEKEIKRADTVTKIGQTIINNAQVQLNAWKEANEYGFNQGRFVPGILLPEEKN